MKVFIFLILHFFMSASFSQETLKKEKHKKNILKLGLPAILVSSFAFSYEREINKKTSFQIQTNFTATDLSSTPNTGFILTSEYRYYPKREGFAGFYVSPYLRYNYLRFDPIVSQPANQLNGVAVGLLLGKKWHIGIICLDLFAGPQAATSKLKLEDKSLQDEFNFKFAYNGFGIRAGFALGILF